MFEVGRDYEIHTLEDTVDGTVAGYSTYEVVEWSAPLLKTKQPHGETVFNTASPYFIRAVKRVMAGERKPATFGKYAPGRPPATD